MILLAPKMISAATYYVIKNGNWSSGTFSTSLGGASCGCTPNSSDIVIIPSPYTLTVNFDFTIGTGAGNISTLTIQSGGSFDVSNKNLFVKSGGTLNIYGTLKRAADVQFSNGSVVNTYSGSTFTVTGNFQNNNSSTGITFNGSMTVAGSFTNGVNAIISGTTGTISVNGSVTNNGTTFGGAACSPSPCTFSGGTIL